MTVLSADKSISRKEGGLKSFPVTSGEIIYKGALVCIDADGYLLAAANTGGYKFVGIAMEQKDNASGSDADLWCRVYTTGVYLLTCTSITQAMVGEFMFITDDATVDNLGTNYVCAGRLVEYVSATSGWVDISQRITLGDSPNIGANRGSIVSGMYGYKMKATIEDGESEGVAGYFQAHAAGTSTGNIYAGGCWLNIDAAFTCGSGKLLVGWDVGIYEDSATDIGNGVVVGVQIMAILTDTPGTLFPFRINTTKTITALIAAANSGSVGYSHGTAGTGVVGTIPFAQVVGYSAIRYIDVHAAIS